MTTVRPGERILDRRALDASPFPAALCDTLFAAVLVDDDIDPDLVLPDAIQFDHDTQTLAACFRLCRQLWVEGFDWQELRAFGAKLLRDRDLDQPDRLRFKHIRAKFKHFRYMQGACRADHRYPRMMNWLTISMGKVSDAYRGGRRSEVLGRSMLMRLLLTEVPARRVRGECDRLVLTSPAAFRTLLESDYGRLTAFLATPTVSGHSFHATRKVVGRQLAFWDTLRTLYPTRDRFRMSRWLAAINGSMGSYHDGLVDRRAEDASSYHALFAVPDDIRERIAGLLDLARASRSGG